MAQHLEQHELDVAPVRAVMAHGVTSQVLRGEWASRLLRGSPIDNDLPHQSTAPSPLPMPTHQ